MSSSDEEICKHQQKNFKRYRFDDLATSTFYTKDESQKNLRYVADVVNNKKTFRKKSVHSNSQPSFNVNFHLILVYNTPLIPNVFYFIAMSNSNRPQSY